MEDINFEGTGCAIAIDRVSRLDGGYGNPDMSINSVYTDIGC
ncbi:hypothetical protein [Coleofasciculus sp. F4-SAH-05]